MTQASADTLEALAERVERLTGPNAAVGEEVLLACGWRKTSVGHYFGPIYYWSSPNGMTSFKDEEFYRHNPTASLDAAMSLVPEGWDWAIEANGYAAICSCFNDDYAPVFSGGERPARKRGEFLKPRKKCAKPALALTAACLRALAQQERRG